MLATIFADGPPCSPALRNQLRRGRFTIVLDGAAERARRERWCPNMIAGDLDSVGKATLRHFEKKGVEILHTPDQDYTDLEKAIAWCVLRDLRSIWVAQAFGGRVDHSFANLSFLKRFHSPERELAIFQQNEKVFFAKDQKLILLGKAGRPFAILPFPRCRVKSRGLAFELENASLELGQRESVCNHATGTRVLLSVEGEALVVEGR
jgi:thiamine pyrophosphokinase